MKILPLFMLSCIFLISCAHKPQQNGSVKIVPVEDVQWEKLNPARGNKSPQAGTLWGDRKGPLPTAFLAKFVDGFSSPPHIHNVSYRAIVLKGLIHNDDPKAEKMWMPKTSYWTQPAGEAHITAAKGKVNIALVEIDKGPYLVKPVHQKFKNGEQPFNIHSSNIIWSKKEKASSALLWQDANGQVTGTLLKFSGRINIKSNSARLVVISGHAKAKTVSDTLLAPGSLISLDQSEVSLNCMKKTKCVLYVKAHEKFDII